MSGRIKLALLSLSLIAVAGATPARAEQQGCRELNSICSTGDQCCSKICERDWRGNSTCTNG